MAHNPFDDIQSQLTRLEGMMLQILKQQAAQGVASAPTHEPPISIDQVAKLLNLSRSAVYQNPAIPRHKRHNRLRFFESEILAYIRATSNP